jgi:transforming growth factor-beta-induced protein
MKPFQAVASLLIVGVLFLAACAPAATPAPTAVAEEPAVQEPAMPEPTATPEPVAEEEAMMEKDIVDTAVADGRFTTLAAALTAAGLVDTLKGEGPFTVFAPTDEAFSKLPEGTVESLLLPENLEQLQQILLYHVVSGSVMAADVVQLTSADTAAELPLSIQVKDGNVFINDAQVIITDISKLRGRQRRDPRDRQRAAAPAVTRCSPRKDNRISEPPPGGTVKGRLAFSIKPVI